MIKVSAPGKLFLSGEWAILNIGSPGIVAAVDKRVHAQIEPAEKGISVTIDDFGIKDLEFLSWEDLSSGSRGDEQKETKFLKASITTALRFLKEKGIAFKPFKIRTWGDQSQIEIAGEVKKVGFGSSAASVVAVTKAVLDFHGFQASKEQVYKLSVITHYFAQGKVGSAFDVAASVYGGVFLYKRFDPNWLVQQMESGKPLQEIVSDKWPEFEVEQLEIPEGFELLVGWTKESASTSAMVKQLNEWGKQNPEEHKKGYEAITDLVRELLPEWKAKNKERILELVSRNESLLRELGEKSGVGIETLELRKLSEIANSCGGAGKLSGAGGGDCGIGISFDSQTSEKIRHGWKEAGLYLIDAKVSREGVCAE